MDRSNWLLKVRREVEERYDTLWAPLYGEKWGLYSNTTHQQFIAKLLNLLSPRSTILDAACGAGRYIGTLVEPGHSVVGIDQSQGMLDRARTRHPTVHLEKVGLQEMSYHQIFDGAICMDAMEHVFPEDWPRVLGNFHQALKPSGYLYFTLEIADAEEVEADLARGQALGLPVVPGECVQGDVYHYYPSLAQVREWLRQAGLDMIEEGEGDEYHHFLVRKVADESLRQREAIVASYAEGPDRLEAGLAGLSGEQLDLAASDDTWTIRQMVHHVADGDDLWKSFVKQAIGHPGSRFELQWYWDRPQTEWAARWAYARREVEPSLALLRASRAHIVQLLGQAPEAWDQSLLVHWPSGKEQQVTVAWVVEMQARHVSGHVDDIRRARQAHGL